MSKTKIKSIKARKRWSNHAGHTVELEVGLRYGAHSRAIAPLTAMNLRDTDDIDFCVTYVNDVLNKTLRGTPAHNQTEIDQVLMEARKAHSGHFYIPTVMATLSKAILAAAADTEKLPLWQYLGTFLGASAAETLPLPCLGIYRDTAAPNGASVISGFSVTSVGASSFAEALLWAELVRNEASKLETISVTDDTTRLDQLCQAIEQAGLRPMQDVAISLTIRPGAHGNDQANQSHTPISTDALSGQLVDWVAIYPICSIEDPFASHDLEGFAKLTWAVGKRVQVIGNRLIASNAIPPRNVLSQNAGNALVIDGNPTHTISEIKRLTSAAIENAFSTIVSPGSEGLVNASSLQFAIGWGINQVQIGTKGSSNDVAACNEGLRISERISEISSAHKSIDGNLPARTIFPWG